jgi:lysine 2,3-aminomutase
MAGFLKKITVTQEPKVNAYTAELLRRAERTYGTESAAYRGIHGQYFRMPGTLPGAASSTRHFNAVLGDEYPVGIERFYRRVVVIDLLSACASECVFCVRGLYGRHGMSSGQMTKVVDYLRDDPYLREVLITGGDPLIAPTKLAELVADIAERAPGIKTVRIGTRLPVQAPTSMNRADFSFLIDYAQRFLFEIAVQINHPFELQPEARDVLTWLQTQGARLYSQNVLLRNVNDNIETLAELYDELRGLRLIPYYFYHAVPMVGTDEFRTSLQRGLTLVRELTSSGMLSGMAKPMLTIMTDIGKVTLYEGTIIGYEGDNIQVRTQYRLEDRRKWNPGYELPKTAAVNRAGTIDVTYIDGKD